MNQSSSEPIRLIWDEPRVSFGTVVLAHGAGAAMDTDFMNHFAQSIADSGWRVARFEFPYMDDRRRTGKRRPPDREPVLRATWQSVFDSLDGKPIVIGGKSMGGRIASLMADEFQADGLICLGYPFHPSGRPDKLRVAHLRTLQTPTLILQGERDPLGNATEVPNYPLASQIEVQWLTDGDHSFKPRKASGKTLEENLAAASQAIDAFLQRL